MGEVVELLGKAFDTQGISILTSPQKLLLLINYKIHGVNIFGYRIVSLVVHIVNAILIYVLIGYLFKAHSLLHNDSSNTMEMPQRHVAFAVATLFVSHPMQLQVVTLILQRYTSLAVLFYVLTLIFYIKCRLAYIEEGRHKAGSLKIKNKAVRVNIKAKMFYALAFIMLCIAINTKKIVITLPVVITLVEFTFFSGKNLKRLLLCIPFYLAIPYILFLSTYYLVEPHSEIIDNAMIGRDYTGLVIVNRWQNLLTQLRVIITYIRMLFFPADLTLIYNYPVSFSFWEPRVYTSFIVLSAMFVSAIYLYALAKRKHNTIHRYLLVPSFGILWFFITISPQSSIIPLLNWQLMEYRVYFASIGLFIAVTTALFMIVRAATPQKTVVYFTLPMLTISLVFGAATYRRNIVWQSEVTLYEDNVKKQPASIFANINLASAYMAVGEVDKAISALQHAKSLNPRFGFTYYALTQTNLASAYIHKGRYDDAARELKEVLVYEPKNADLHIRLGLVYVKQELLNDAAEEFKAAIEINKNHVDAHYYLGVIYAAQNSLDDALRQWRHVVRVEPDYDAIHTKIGDVYLQQGKLQDAIGEYEAALRFEKNNAAIYLKICDVYKRLGREADSADACQTALQSDTKDVKDSATYLRLGLMHETQGNLDEAARQYSLAIKLDPKSAEAHNNLGVVLGKQGKLDEAFNEISKAINIRPDYADAHNNLGLCLRLQGKTDKAKEEFAAALKIDPNHRGAKVNLESLK
ncbi:MAG: tetratricopeptide repeat protein [Nitrospirae bacterium]|nr:tetratricopeptide repeat protein [Nitrospirota bacterium]